MVNGYRPLMLGSNRSSDPSKIFIIGENESPSVGAQIGQFGLGLASVFLNAAICRAADPTTRGGGGGGSTTKAPAEQTQLSDADKEVLSICAQYDLAGMDTEIQKMETRLNEINTEFAKQNNYLDLATNKEYLENEANIKKFEEKYAFGNSKVSGSSTDEQKNGNAYQNIMQQIDNLESQQTVRNTRINTLETNWGKDSIKTKF